MKPIFTKCDACNHEFYLKQFKIDKLKNTIEKTYFNCPECEKEYVCFYTDEEIRTLQAKMRELHRKMKWASGNELEQLKKDETHLKDFIAHCMASIKREFEGSE